MTDDQHEPAPPESEAGKSPLARLLERHLWIAFVGPFVVYMLLLQLEPLPPEDPQVDLPPVAASNPNSIDPNAADPNLDDLSWLYEDDSWISYDHYPIVYSLKIALTLIVIVLVWPYLRGFEWRVSPLAVAVGAFGTVVWVVLVDLGIESAALSLVGLGSAVEGTRSAFNPLEQLRDNTAWMYTFLAIRFFGLAMLVPVIEELFLRGFLMRFLTQIEWWTLPLKDVTFSAIAFTTFLAMTMHPGELVAELVWFSMVTLLMLRTGNLWDCIVAHGVTNLLLGVYVLATGKWYFM